MNRRIISFFNKISPENHSSSSIPPSLQQDDVRGTKMLFPAKSNANNQRYKVGRVEQLETSEEAKARGAYSVILRKLVKVLTPSTNVDGNIGPDANHLLAIKEESNGSDNGSVTHGYVFVDCVSRRLWVGSVDEDACSAFGALLMQVSHKDIINESRGGSVWVTRERPSGYFEFVDSTTERAASSIILGRNGLDQFLTRFEAAVDSGFPNYQNHDVTDTDEETLRVLAELFLEKSAQQFEVVHAINCIDVLRFFPVTSGFSCGIMSRPVIVPTSKSTSKDSGVPVLKMKGLWHSFSLGETGRESVPNDMILGENEDRHRPRTLLPRGPNMGGKSKLLRAMCFTLSLIILLCCLGSSVANVNTELRDLLRVDDVRLSEWVGIFSNSSLPRTLFLPQIEDKHVLEDSFILSHHVVPMRLSFTALLTFTNGAIIPTADLGKFLKVTNSHAVNFSLSGAIVTYPNMVVEDTYIIHGIDSFFDLDIFAQYTLPAVVCPEPPKQVCAEPPKQVCAEPPKQVCAHMQVCPELPMQVEDNMVGWMSGIYFLIGMFVSYLIIKGIDEFHDDDEPFI